MLSDGEFMKIGAVEVVLYCMIMKEEEICFSETLVTAILTGCCNQMITMNVNCHEKPSFIQFECLCVSYTRQIVSGSMLLGSKPSSDEKRILNVVILILPIPFGNCLSQF